MGPQAVCAARCEVKRSAGPPREPGGDSPFIREQDTLGRECWFDSVPALFEMARQAGLPGELYRFGRGAPH